MADAYFAKVYIIVLSLLWLGPWTARCLPGQPRIQVQYVASSLNPDPQASLEFSKWGNDPGEYCWDALKFRCYDVVNVKPECGCMDCAETCTSLEKALIRAGESCRGGRQKLCCSSDKEWKDCALSAPYEGQISLDKRDDSHYSNASNDGPEPWPLHWHRDSQLNSADTMVTSRSQIAKRSQKTLQWKVNGVSDEADFGPYPSCNEAAAKTAVTKWYGFDELGSTTPCCPTQLTKFTVQQINKSQYQSRLRGHTLTLRMALIVLGKADHIFEAQTILYFFDFLRGGHSYDGLPNMPSGYTAANDLWVSGTLMGYLHFYPSVHVFPVEGYGSLLQAISSDLGGNSGEGRLALLYSGINLRKGQLFGFKSPERIDLAGLRATKLLHRDVRPPSADQQALSTLSPGEQVAGVFQYLQQDTIWHKFQITSQLVEQSLHEFDMSYSSHDPANQVTRPTRANGQPRAGLRDLWCYFIDKYLQAVETKGRLWTTAARSTFADNPMSKGSEGQDWLNTVLSGNGVVTPGRMIFPHQGPQTPGAGTVVQSSYYGAWKLGPAGPF
ncbi:hypothetical protein MMC10_007598 [Thelotrema lepadinum]|nr:hypothetical protein [Thelotrema lepadinum]